jgi:hypothetical protein
MKKLMMIVAFAGLTGAINAQEQTAPDPNAPEIKWESTTIDYGNVKKGDENAASKEFKFTNVGKTPLILSSCRGSCGCTVPTCPTEPILPGKSGTIKVHYDVQRVGAFTKTVTVTSNAKEPNETLKITGTVLDDAAPAETTAPAQPAPAQPAKPVQAAQPTKGKSAAAKENAKGQQKKAEK